jgi:dUTP pyrophosphatase
MSEDHGLAEALRQNEERWQQRFQAGERVDRALRQDELLAARTQDDGLPVFPPVPFPGDCGLDLATTRDVRLLPGESQDLPCGVAVALPPGTFGWVTGRSSTWSKWGLWTMPGIIDEGWRGELRALVHRPWDGSYGNQVLRIPAGTRIAQLIVLPNLLGQVQIQQVGTLPPSERGTRGFGSSG